METLQLIVRKSC